MKYIYVSKIFGQYLRASHRVRSSITHNDSYIYPILKFNHSHMPKLSAHPGDIICLHVINTDKCEVCIAERKPSCDYCHGCVFFDSAYNMCTNRIFACTDCYFKTMDTIMENL